MFAVPVGSRVFSNEAAPAKRSNLRSNTTATPSKQSRARDAVELAELSDRIDRFAPVRLVQPGIRAEAALMLRLIERRSGDGHSETSLGLATVTAPGWYADILDLFAQLPVRVRVG